MLDERVTNTLTSRTFHKFVRLLIYKRSLVFSGNHASFDLFSRNHGRTVFDCLITCNIALN